ncbi:hypothetical protein ACJMK2_005217, partial [Sinanodonta woodiana]
SMHGKYVTVDDITTRNSTPPPSTSPRDGFGSGTPSPSPSSRTNTSLPPSSSPTSFNGSRSSSLPPSPPFNGSGSSSLPPSPPFNGSGSSTSSPSPQPYNVSEKLTPLQSTLTPHNNYSQSLTTLSSRPPTINGTLGSLPPQNWTSLPPPQNGTSLPPPPAVGRRRRDTLLDGGMPLGTPMTTPPPNVIGTQMPPGPSQIIVLLELKMRPDAKFTEEEVRIGLSEAVKEIITRNPYADIIANIDLPSLSVYFSQANKCQDPNLIRSAWSEQVCQADLRTFTSGDRFIMC